MRGEVVGKELRGRGRGRGERVVGGMEGALGGAVRGRWKGGRRGMGMRVSRGVR